MSDTRPAPMVKVLFSRSPSPRDVVLIVLGALAMHTFSAFFDLSLNGATTSVTVNNELNLPAHDAVPARVHDHNLALDRHAHAGGIPTIPSVPPSEDPRVGAVSAGKGTGIDLTQVSLPETKILQHAPGWTLFENVYMSNGTIFILSDKGKSAFPGQ